MLISTKRIKTLYSTFIKMKYHEQSQACLVFLSLKTMCCLKITYYTKQRKEKIITHPIIFFIK